MEATNKDVVIYFVSDQYPSGDYEYLRSLLGMELVNEAHFEASIYWLYKASQTLYIFIRTNEIGLTDLLENSPRSPSLSPDSQPFQFRVLEFDHRK